MHRLGVRLQRRAKFQRLEDPPASRRDQIDLGAPSRTLRRTFAADRASIRYDDLEPRPGQRQRQRQARRTGACDQDFAANWALGFRGHGSNLLNYFALDQPA